MPKNSLFLQRSLPWLILGSGLIITYILQDIAQKENFKKVEERFDFRANEIVSNIQSRIHSYREVLQGAKGLFVSSQNVTRNEFQEYVKQLNLIKTYPGIQGVGFTLYIKPSELAQHTQKIRNEGFPNYSIRPDTERSIYTSIIYLEPFDWRNQRAFGFDMFTEPVRREAMQRALDENKTISSGRVTLVQETGLDRQPGFLIYLPVFQLNQPHATLAERRNNILGWVYAPFRMHDLMQGIMGPHFGEADNPIAFDIYDGNTASPAKLMYDFNTQTGAKPSDHEPVFSTIKHIDIGDHRWTVSIRSLPSLEERLEYKNADHITAVGVMISLMLALIVWLLLNGRRRAYAIAEGMTQELSASELHTRQLNRELKLLSDCNMAMLKTENEHVLLQKVCHMIVEEGGYLMAWVGFSENDEAKTILPVAEAGFDDGYLQSIKLSWGDNEYGHGPTGVAIRNGHTDINHDYHNNPRMAPWRNNALKHGFQSSIAIPLAGSKGVFGAITIYSAESNMFSKAEVSLLEELAADLSYGIETLRTRAEHKLNEDKIKFLAYHDTLTKLPNRLLLHDCFNLLSETARQGQTRFGVVMLDLDNFKHVNDTLGHSIGDMLLMHVTERLLANIGSDDLLSRHGSDKFVLLLNNTLMNNTLMNNTLMNDTLAANNLAERIKKIVNAFTEPFEVEENVIDSTASIGIAIFPDHGNELDSLLKKADVAMYYAKDNGRNTYQFYTEKMDIDRQEEMELQGQLHNAIKNKQLLLYYQPQVNINNNTITGFEALLRWQHPEKGMISPAKFIPLAERSGLIIPIGEWVLNEACRQSKVWLDKGHPLVIAANLSTIQFKRGNLLETVSNALESSGLPGHMLELELTESILLQDVDVVMETLRELKKLGTKLSIDDFGTGYSSLSYLKKLAIDKLKIDQSFVADLSKDADDNAIVNTIIQLGHSLKLTVIAEGVETSTQLALLKKYGCDEMQGYYFSEPIPANQVCELLDKNLPTNFNH